MIYFDNAASTPVCDQALQAVVKHLDKNTANASSAHTLGRKTNKLILQAKAAFEKILSLSNGQIIFTSGATEANNIAVHSIYSRYIKEGRKYNIVTLPIEHASVYNTIQQYFSGDLFEIRYIKTNPDGTFDTDHFLSLIDEETLLISIGFVNNELGSRYEICTLACEAKKINPDLIFHSDMAQSAVKIPFHMDNSHIDIITLSGHKFHSPQGIGALIAKEHVKLSPLVLGGDQEGGLRAGTENVAFIEAMRVAAEYSSARLREDFTQVSQMRSFIEKEIEDRVADVIFNTPQNVQKSTPYILSVAFEGCKGEVLMRMLDEAGICVSTSSACSSRKGVSYALLNAGIDRRVAEATIRISFSRYNTFEECSVLVDALEKAVKRMRRFSPNKRISSNKNKKVV